MKRRLTALTLSALMMTSSTMTALAAPGDSGFFGGVSEGIMLPKNIEQQVAIKANKNEKLLYKEVIFLTGQPIEVSGTMEITRDDSKVQKSDSGSYTETYKIQAVSADNTTQLDRVVKLTTYFVKYDSPYGYQVKKDSTVSSWTETITTNGQVFTVDETKSDFGEGRNFSSFIQDTTPGISYYNGNTSYHVLYTLDSDVYAEVTVSGSSYGYDQTWSKAEKQDIKMTVNRLGTEPWVMNVQINPFMNSSKDVHYEANNLSAISFSGSYTQVIDTEGGLTYEITTNHPDLKKNQLKGSAYLKPINDFEKLRLPEKLKFIQPSHYAYWDIMKLMSMEVIGESSNTFQPYKAVTRGEFTVMLSRALSILPPTDDRQLNNGKIEVFADVTKDHELYQWLYAAKDSKLVQGRENNFFKPDELLTREEAFSLLIRVIGLDHIGIDTTKMTAYVDDEEISSWAREALYKGTELGLFSGYQDGKIKPQGNISKAESAAIINRLINFLKKDMVEMYMKEL